MTARAIPPAASPTPAAGRPAPRRQARPGGASSTGASSSSASSSSVSSSNPRIPGPRRKAERQSTIARHRRVEQRGHRWREQRAALRCTPRSSPSHRARSSMSMPSAIMAWVKRPGHPPVRRVHDRVRESRLDVVELAARAVGCLRAWMRPVSREESAHLPHRRDDGVCILRSRTVDLPRVHLEQELPQVAWRQLGEIRAAQVVVGQVAEQRGVIAVAVEILRLISRPGRAVRRGRGPWMLLSRPKPYRRAPAARRESRCRRRSRISTQVRTRHGRCLESMIAENPPRRAAGAR